MDPATATEQGYRILTNEGLAVFLVVVGLIFLWYCGKGIYRGCEWFGANILLPLRDRIVKHLDDVSASMNKLAQAIDRMETTVGVRFDRLEDRIDNISGEESHRAAQPERR